VRGQIRLTPSLVTFAPAAWANAQTVTVTAVNDRVDEPDPHADSVAFAVASADTNYNGLAVAPLAVAVGDDDQAGVRISTNAVAVAEGGASAVYTLVLLSEPTATVTVRITEATAQVRLGRSVAVFTPATWSNVQAVTVTAVDDSVVETDPHAAVVSNVLVSADANYNGRGTQVLVSIAENDEAPPVITIAASASEASEAGGMGEFILQSSRLAPSNLTVRLQIAGSAVNGTDCAAIPSAAAFPRGSSQTAIPVAPKWDNDAETDETIEVRVLAGAGYAVGIPDQATVTIHPSPIDTWKIGFFGVNANLPAAHDTADWDGDGIKNLMEYVLNRNPIVRDSEPEFRTGMERTASNQVFAVRYTRRANLPDATIWVQVRTNLTGYASWMQGTNHVAQSVVSSDGTVQDVKALVVKPAASDTRFEAVRLRVTRP
jgi:hypothetical protein